MSEHPTFEAWLDEIKSSPESPGVGMYLMHNGVVRGHSRDGSAVTGMDLACDRDRLREVVEEIEARPGVIALRVWINEGRLVGRRRHNAGPGGRRHPRERLRSSAGTGAPRQDRVRARTRTGVVPRGAEPSAARLSGSGCASRCCRTRSGRDRPGASPRAAPAPPRDPRPTSGRSPGPRSGRRPPPASRSRPVAPGS